MTKIKLVDNTIINTKSVELINGVLRISTTELTVEELANIFSDKEKTNLITLMTESEIETGFQTGFTSFAGVVYDAEGNKIVALYQPVDASEQRIANAEGTSNLAMAEVNELGVTVDTLLGLGGI